MTLDLGSAPRGDPRMTHVSENFFNVCFLGTQAAHLILWTRGRTLVTELRPRKYDRCVQQPAEQPANVQNQLVVLLLLPLVCL